MENVQLETSGGQLDPPIVSNKNPWEAPSGPQKDSAPAGGHGRRVLGDVWAQRWPVWLGFSDLRLLAWPRGGHVMGRPPSLPPKGCHDYLTL